MNDTLGGAIFIIFMIILVAPEGVGKQLGRMVNAFQSAIEATD